MSAEPKPNKLAIAGLAVSKRIPPALNLRDGAKLSIEISMPPGGYKIEVVAVIPLRRQGRIIMHRHVVDTERLDHEHEVWARLSEMAQAKLCDIADRAELEGKIR